MPEAMKIRRGKSQTLVVRCDSDAVIPFPGILGPVSLPPSYRGARHGFKCGERANGDRKSADIAGPRSREFFGKYLKA